MFSFYFKYLLKNLSGGYDNISMLSLAQFQCTEAWRDVMFMLVLLIIA